MDELVILLTQSSWQLHERQLRDVRQSLYTESLIPEWEQEGERAEVITLGQVGAHSALHVPEGILPVRDRLLVGEEVRVSLHRDPEPLGEDVVSSGRGLFHTLDVLLVPII